MKLSRLAAAGLSLPLALGVAASTARAQNRPGRDTSFTWSGAIPAGRWIRIKNLNGRITVEPSSGNKVEVTATKSWRRGDPALVHFDVQKFGPHNESVVICALWGDRSSCNEDGYDSNSDRGSRNNDVSVEFRVLVPKGVDVGASTVRGNVLVEGATAEVDAHTVNGETEVMTSGGPVNASSVNGHVRAQLGATDTNQDMTFTSVNGSVVVEVTGDLNGDVEMNTVNGALRSDYAMTLSGRINPRHLRAHVGRPGGPLITLTTVNGSVELRKR